MFFMTSIFTFLIKPKNFNYSKSSNVFGWKYFKENQEFLTINEKYLCSVNRPLSKTALWPLLNFAK